eukprot:gnl/Hemi2/25261_TR8501_c0_g1_i1.p1 gnl/Hemi2/25261_TR8501_c0_g1~~gnl/Hemi2/25261_TR8501_c0_g1_i1.p1  ORF type:complete len:253 (+),score=43.27 gnl/Hemi2/25261_TR8501_c0_g1_i1:218-976(+)
MSGVASSKPTGANSSSSSSSSTEDRSNGWQAHINYVLAHGIGAAALFDLSSLLCWGRSEKATVVPTEREDLRRLINMMMMQRHSLQPGQPSVPHGGWSTRLGDFASVLPDDVTRHIFSFLTIGDLAQTSRVCKRWNSFCNDNLVWQAAFFRYYCDPPTEPVTNWKQYFKQIKQTSQVVCQVFGNRFRVICREPTHLFGVGIQETNREKPLMVAVRTKRALLVGVSTSAAYGMHQTAVATLMSWGDRLTSAGF